MSIWILLSFFLLNLKNFIKLLIYSECVWIVLYCNTLTISSIIDDLNLLNFGIFIIGFAGAEYAIGILLIMSFKKINTSVNLDLKKNNNFKLIQMKNSYNLKNYF